MLTIRNEINKLLEEYNGCCERITSFLEVLKSVQENNTISDSRKEKYIKYLTDAINYQDSKLDEFKSKAEELHLELDKLESDVNHLKEDSKLTKTLLDDLSTDITSLLLSLNTKQ